MRITILGATGQTGQLLVEQALERGYKVMAFARTPEKLRFSDKNLRIVQGDVCEAISVERAIQGTDVVISVLGPTKNEPLFDVSQGMEHILKAMNKYNVDRLVVSVGAGVGDPHDEPGFFNLVINFLLKLFSRWVYEDMVRVAEMVRDSELDWILVRVPMLTSNEPTGEIKVGYVGKGMGPRITRGDLATFMLDQVEVDSYVHQAPAISN